MSRVPPTEAAKIAGVKPGTLRRWVHDGRLIRYWDGFDFDDLITARDSRSLDALCVRAGIIRDHRPGQVA